MYEKYKWIIKKYFDDLNRTFTYEQSFHIILISSIINWININDKYSSELLIIDKISNEKKFENFVEELKKFERKFNEFDGLLTGMINKIFVSENKLIEDKIINIFNSIKNYLEDIVIKDFINVLVIESNTQNDFNKTPESINEILSGLINLNKVESIADYCSGISNTAIKIFEDLKKNRKNKEIFYYAEEINANNYLISKLLMVINGIDNYKIINKDILEYNDYYEQLKFDFIISDMPKTIMIGNYLCKWDARFKYGLPKQNSADWAFGQNVIYNLSETGIGVIIGTKGTLVRGSEKNIREGIINDDLIECVITLPENLYEKSVIGSEMIIFNKNKPNDRIKKVLFIDASQYGYRINKNQHSIEAKGIYRILKTYESGIEELGFSKFIDLEKIKEYDYRLNPIEYLGFDTLRSKLSDPIRLSEVAVISKGKKIDKKNSSIKSQYYYINVKDVEKGSILYDEETKIESERIEFLSGCDIKEGDVIITSKGWAIKVAIVEEDFKPAFISENLTKIRVNFEKYNPYVLFEFLQSKTGREMLEGLQTGTTVKLLNNKQLERLEIPKYDIEFMNEIGDEIKKNKIEYNKKIREAERTFNFKRNKLVEKLNLN